MHIYEANGECCRPKHAHQHEHGHDHSHHVVKGIGSACLSGACGHIEHIGGVASVDLQHVQEQIQQNLWHEKDDDDETDPITGKKKRKSHRKFRNTGVLAGIS